MFENIEKYIINETIIKIFKALFITMIIIGIIGNSLNIVIFSKKIMSKNFTFKILLTLAITDLIILVFCGSESYMNLTYNIDIRNQSTYICKIDTFLVYFLTQIRNFLTMTLTVLRAKVVSEINNRNISQVIKPANSGSNYSTYNKYDNTESNSLIEARSPRALEIRVDLLPRRPIENKINFGIESGVEIITQTSTLNESSTISRAIIDNLKNIVSTYKKISTQKFKIIIFSIIFVLFILNLHFIIFLETVIKTQQIDTNSTYLNYDSLKKMSKNFTLSYECSPVKASAYEYFLHNIYFWVDTFIYFCIPFVSMSISFVLIRTVLKSLNEIYLVFIIDQNNNSNSRIYRKKIHKNKKIINILMFINLYFFLSVLPFFIYNILVYKFNSGNKIFFKILVDMLFYSNNAFNVFLYGISSEKYKQELLKIIKIF
jgi:hypothetical protein